MFITETVWLCAWCFCVYSAIHICFHLPMVLYMTAALHLLLYHLQCTVYNFIDIYGQQKQQECIFSDESLSFKWGGLLYTIRATLVRGPLSYIICWYHVTRGLRNKAIWNIVIYITCPSVDPHPLKTFSISLCKTTFTVFISLVAEHIWYLAWSKSLAFSLSLRPGEQ